MKNIRAKSVCLFRHQDKVLLAEGFDPAKNEHYLIPIGGGIDFGETAEQAVKREVQEEVGAEVQQLKLLGVLENLFSFNDQEGHEIVFVYEANFKDENFYNKSELQGVESNGFKFKVRWFDKSHIRSGQVNIYPNGIVNML